MAIEFAPDWQPMAMAAVGLCLLVVGAIYAVGGMVDSEKLQGWAKSEFLQVVASGFLVAGLLVFATGLESVSQSIAGQDHIEYAQNYLNGLNDKLELLYLEAQTYDSVLEILANVRLGLSSIVASVSAEPFAGFRMVANHLELATTVLFGAIVSNAVQISLLTFVQSTMMYYFLPAGVILRCFSPTRAVGAFLIALAVGLYFVFPLTYVLANESVAKMNSDIQSAADQMNAFDALGQLSQNGLLDVTALKNFVLSLPSSFFGIPGTVGSLIQTVLADLFMQVLILPVLGLTITVIFIRQLSHLLGAYVDVGPWGVWP